MTATTTKPDRTAANLHAMLIERIEARELDQQLDAYRRDRWKRFEGYIRDLIKEDRERERIVAQLLREPIPYARTVH